MRRPYRCRKCGYNFLIEVRLEPETGEGIDKPRREQKCPKCGATT